MQTLDVKATTVIDGSGGSSDSSYAEIYTLATEDEQRQFRVLRSSVNDPTPTKKSSPPPSPASKVDSSNSMPPGSVEIGTIAETDPEEETQDLDQDEDLVK